MKYYNFEEIVLSHKLNDIQEYYFLRVVAILQ